MTYTDDREAFEAQFFKPPFLARMLERTGRYIDGLEDAEAFIKAAHEAFWQLRNEIKNSGLVTIVWERALRQAALSRPRWFIRPAASKNERPRWVQSRYLGRHI